RLEKAGHRFRTASDTETIVHSYEECGLDFASALEGMFAIVLWDSRLKRLVLARDRIGLKPLYYTLTPTGLVFGSEIKALLCHPDVPRIPDLISLYLLLAFGYTPTN